MAVKKGTIARAVILTFLVIVALLYFVRPFRPSPRRLAVDATQAPPPADRVTPEGLIAVDSSSLFARMRRSRARGIVVGAWASWCGSCKDDVPLLIGLRKTFPQDIEVMLVSVDDDVESRAAAAERLKEFGETEPSYVVDESLTAFKAAMHPSWPGMLPATFLFDSTAKVHYFWGGPVMENELVPLVRRYLAGENIDGMADFALIHGKAKGE
jgi:thiol-disulfide isomerase/thioredoxin